MNCAMCKHWEGTPAQERAACLRFPPTPVAAPFRLDQGIGSLHVESTYESLQPFTNATDRCGEFHDRLVP